MQLATIPQGLTKTIFVENPLSAIIVEANYANELIPANSNTLTEFSTLKTELSGAKISVLHKTKDNKVIHLYTKEELIQLIEFNQKGEGVIPVSQPTSTTRNLQGVLTIGENGSIPFNNDETLEITVDNSCQVDLNLHVLETPVLSPTFVQLNSQTIQGDRKTKTFDLTDVVEISIPWTCIHTNTELTFTASNGVTCRYGKVQLETIDSLTNDSVYATPYGMIHRGTSVVLDVSEFVTLRWDRDTTSSISFLTKEYKVIDNVKEVAIKNNSLIDTTENKTENEITNKLN